MNIKNSYFFSVLILSCLIFAGGIYKNGSTLSERANMLAQKSRSLFC